MITAAQLRAARGLLDWTRNELAEAAKVSPETVKNIEHGVFRPQEQTAEAIIRAFAAHDVMFTEDEGVKIAKAQIKTFSGKEGYNDFLNDIIATMRQGGKTRQFNFSDNIISTYGDKRIEEYSKIMASIPNLEARCLVPEGDINTPIKHCEYRWLKKVHNNAIPYFLYGNKVAMMINNPDDEVAFVSIYSEALAKAHIHQFDAYWEESVAISPKKVIAK
jgi:DNA-binding XRE family transcriptional regulator